MFPVNILIKNAPVKSSGVEGAHVYGVFARLAEGFTNKNRSKERQPWFYRPLIDGRIAGQVDVSRTQG